VFLSACGRDPVPDGRPGQAVGADSVERARVTGFWARYRDATTRRIAGNLEAASEAYARALELDPTHGDALYYLGGMRLALGDFPAAERAWRLLAETDSSSARAHSQLGVLFLCLDEGAPFQLDSAEAHFERAHQLNREETGPLLRLAEAALVRGDAARASGFIGEVLGSHRTSSAARFYAGYLAWKREDRGAAERLYREAAAAADSAPAPAGAVPGEGDTRGGGPMTAHPPRCDQFRQLTASLGQPPGMAGRYLRLDSLLQAARRRVR
jgi:tetratricopeptide (TPR) repeat protein